MFISFTNLPKTEDNKKFYFGLIACLIIATGLILYFIQPGVMYTDGGIFSAVAYKDLKGGTLYVDAWENKPPGIFYYIEIFLILIPNKVYALFFMVYISLMVLSASIYIYLFNQFKSLSLTLIFGSIALAYTIYKNNVGDGLYTEIYGILFIMVGLAISSFYNTHQRRITEFLPLVFFGCSFWFREPYILIALVASIIHLRQIQVRKKLWQYVVFFSLPSILFLSILYITGSLTAFVEMLEYSLFYASQSEVVSLKVKFNDFYVLFGYHNLSLIFFLIYSVTIIYKYKTAQLDFILYLLLFFTSIALVIISPHNFGHYYFPVFVMFFVSIASIYGLLLRNGVELKWPMIIISAFAFYNINYLQCGKLKFELVQYEEDRITKLLKQSPSKTLFVDYVDKSDYYIKAKKVPITFVPVALPIHFKEDKFGLENRKRIYKEIMDQKPDFLITTYTTAYFSWFFPESEYYNKHYQKIDSISKVDENIVILWKRKKE